jgi:hypothetical protein
MQYTVLRIYTKGPPGRVHGRLILYWRMAASTSLASRKLLAQAP